MILIPEKMARLGLIQARTLLNGILHPLMPVASALRQLPVRCQLGANIHTTNPVKDLKEFFEVEKFRGEKAVRVGREWR